MSKHEEKIMILVGLLAEFAKTNGWSKEKYILQLHLVRDGIAPGDSRLDPATEALAQYACGATKAAVGL